MKFAGFAKNPANRGVVTFLDAYPNVVECVVAGAPDSTSAVPTPSKQGNPSAGLSPAPTEDAVVIKYVNLGLSNGMKIEHHNLSYSGLQSFISKLQALCLA